MAKLEMRCETCQAPVTAHVGQSSVDGKLRWYYAYHCEKCDSTLESDDVGLPPDNVRELMMSESGLWRVVVSGGAEVKVKTLSALRRAFGLDLQQASRLARQFPVVFKGTLPEAEWLSGILESEGLQSDVHNLDAPTR